MSAPGKFIMWIVPSAGQADVRLIMTEFCGSLSHQVNVVWRHSSRDVTASHEDETILNLLPNFDVFATGFIHFIWSALNDNCRLHIPTNNLFRE